MRYDGVLNFRNMPYQNFINSGYFEVVTRVINDKCIYQTMLTGKGQIWLHTRMKKRFGI
jgi:phage antirepressor YoqD-like protein